MLVTAFATTNGAALTDVANQSEAIPAGTPRAGERWTRFAGTSD